MGSTNGMSSEELDEMQNLLMPPETVALFADAIGEDIRGAFKLAELIREVARKTRGDNDTFRDVTLQTLLAVFILSERTGLSKRKDRLGDAAG